MASEMAEFLWDKFLNAFEEAESELLLGIFSHFTAIKQVMETGQNRKMEICSSADSSVLSLLHRLNDAISDCRVFAQQMNSPTKHPLRLNPLSEFFFVKKMRRRLLKIKAEFLDLKIATQGRKQGEGTSEPDRTKEGNESRIFGFDEYKLEYEQKLLEGYDGLKAIGIHGMGGSGKTTLAKQIYNTERVRTEFVRRIWVSLSDIVESNEPEIGGKVVKLVLKEIGYGIDRMKSNNNWDDLLVILNGELKSERYLIVLDDIWINHEFWDSFVKVLPVNMGGALIVTSRIEDVARRIVGEENLFPIPLLDKDDCWKIFLYSICEFHLPILEEEKNKIKELDRPIMLMIEPIFAEIEEEIKNQFPGFPLAAKTLAEVINKSPLVAETVETIIQMTLLGIIYNINSSETLAQIGAATSACQKLVNQIQRLNISRERDRLDEIFRNMGLDEIFRKREGLDGIIRQLFLRTKRLPKVEKLEEIVKTFFLRTRFIEIAEFKTRGFLNRLLEMGVNYGEEEAAKFLWWDVMRRKTTEIMSSNLLPDETTLKMNHEVANLLLEGRADDIFRKMGEHKDFDVDEY